MVSNERATILEERSPFVSKMSSLGGQWRVIRHYLSLTNLNAEVEKLVQRIKPATPEQWDGTYLRNTVYHTFIIKLSIIMFKT